MKQLHDHDTGDTGDAAIDPRWNPTYQFSSPAPPRGTENTHALSVYMTVDAYPTTAQDRRELVNAFGPRLVEEWLTRGLPVGELFHLVHRPGELGPSEAQRIHRADQADALAREHGGVPVVLVLTNIPIRPDLVVARVRFE